MWWSGAHHADSGDQVHILIVAEGSTTVWINGSTTVFSELAALSDAARKAASILGASGVEFLDFPDNRLDSFDRLDLIKAIEKCFSRYKPDCVYVHHAGDLNVDHRRLHEAVVTACRPTPNHTVKRLLSYEVASSTEWQPSGSAPVSTPVGSLIFQISGNANRGSLPLP